MRIHIQRPGHRTIRLAFPTALFCNALTASIAARVYEKQQKEEDDEDPSPALSAKQFRALFREIRRVKRRFRKSDWKLCDVESADGTHVTVRL